VQIKPKLIKKKFFSETDERGVSSAVNFSNLFNDSNHHYQNFSYQFWAHSRKKMTFRGFHFQREPHEQNKFILVHAGSLIDFAISTDTNLPKTIFIFKVEAGNILFIPKGFAHAYLCTEENVVMQYLMDCPYHADSYTGFNGRFLFDSELQKKLIISNKDSALATPNYTSEMFARFQTVAKNYLQST
jgi:dTDP-4-dehydrorhamnose 3,5-epimerase-like enzyme